MKNIIQEIRYRIKKAVEELYHNLKHYHTSSPRTPKEETLIFQSANSYLILCSLFQDRIPETTKLFHYMRYFEATALERKEQKN
jgi:hypothetical protein